MITYDFHTDSQILKIFLKEEILIEDIILTIQYITEDAKLPENVNVIIHVDNSDLIYNPKNLIMLSSLLKTSFDNYKSIKCSIIDNNNNNELNELFKHIYGSEKFNYKFFSNKDDALKWLN